MLNGKIKTHIDRVHDLTDKIADAFKKGEEDMKAKDKEYKNKAEVERREQLQLQILASKQKRVKKKPNGSNSLNSFE